MFKGKYDPRPITRSYEQLKEILDCKIAIMKGKVDILDQAKNTKQPVSFSQNKILNQKVILQAEEICLILEAKSTVSLARRGQIYQPVLINNELFQFKDVICASIEEQLPFHYDLIIQAFDAVNCDTAHYSPCQLDFDGKTVISVFHDAAGIDNFNGSINGRFVEFLIQSMQKLQDDDPALEFKNINLKSCIQNLPIQTDRYSCSIFAIQDLNSMHKIGTKNLSSYFYDYNELVKQYYGSYCSLGVPLDQSDKQIKKLHPRFVKNAQTSEVINANLSNSENQTLIVSKAKNLEQYIANYSVEVITQENGTVKKQNHAIDYKTFKALRTAREKLEEIYQRGGEKLLQEIIQQRTGGVVFDSKFATKIKTVYNLDNITNTRSVSKLAYAEGFEGDLEHKTAAYLSVCDGLVLDSAHKSPAELEFKKKPIEGFQVDSSLDQNINLQYLPLDLRLIDIPFIDDYMLNDFT